MATRNENLNRIRNAVGSYSQGAKNTTQMNGPRYEETSRDESLRILQSALSGGSTAGTTPQSAVPAASSPYTGEPNTSSGTVAPPSPQGEGLSAQRTGRSAEQVQQEKPLKAADYDRLIREKEAELARWEEWDFDATNPTERQEYDNGIKAYENEIESLKAAKWKAEKEEQYGSLKNNADYETFSSAAEDKPTAGFGIGWGTSWWGKGDPVYDYINDIDGTREKWNNPSTMGHSPYSIYDYMDEDEIKTYNYLYNTESKEAAGKYLDYIEYALNDRSTKRIAQSAAEMADKHPVVSSAASIPTNLVSGIGLADAAWQNLKREFTGEYVPIDYNRGAMAPSVMTSAIRGTVAQNIADSTGVIALDEEEHPYLSKIFNGKSLGDVYQLGMSMADSLTVALTPFGQYGAVLLGGSAGTQGMLDALERGASDEQAIKMGLLNATFEALFEYASLDKLLTGNPKNLISALLQQGGVEASEEAATTLANNVADILVMAEKSDYQLKIQAYMESGMSKEEATKQALLDKCIELGWDAVGGFFSGGISGSISTKVSGIHTRGETQTQTPTQAQAQAQTQTQTQAEAQTRTLTQAQTQAETQTQAQTQTLTRAQTQAQVQTEAQAQTEAQSLEEVQAQDALPGTEQNNAAAKQATNTTANTDPAAAARQQQYQTEIAAALRAGDYQLALKRFKEFGNPNLRALNEVQTLKAFGDYAAAMGYDVSPETHGANGIQSANRDASNQLDSLEKAKEADYNTSKDKMISLSLRFVSNRDDLYTNLQKVPPLDGYEDILCHADAISFGFVDPVTGENVQDFDAKFLATRIIESGKYNGGPIRLFSCEAGKYEDGPAQKLADEMGVNVLAPTKAVFIHPMGYVIVADSEEEANKLLEIATEKWTPEGWKEFKPKEGNYDLYRL